MYELEWAVRLAYELDRLLCKQVGLVNEGPYDKLLHSRKQELIKEGQAMLDGKIAEVSMEEPHAVARQTLKLVIIGVYVDGEFPDVDLPEKEDVKENPTQQESSTVDPEPEGTDEDAGTTDTTDDSGETTDDESTDKSEPEETPEEAGEEKDSETESSKEADPTSKEPAKKSKASAKVVEKK